MVLTAAVEHHLPAAALFNLVLFVFLNQAYPSAPLQAARNQSKVMKFPIAGWRELLERG